MLYAVHTEQDLGCLTENLEHPVFVRPRQRQRMENAYHSATVTTNPMLWFRASKNFATRQVLGSYGRMGHRNASGSGVRPSSYPLARQDLLMIQHKHALEILEVFTAQTHAPSSSTPAEWKPAGRRCLEGVAFYSSAHHMHRETKRPSGNPHWPAAVKVGTGRAGRAAG